MQVNGHRSTAVKPMRPGSRVEKSARIAPRAGLSLRATRACVARRLAPDQLIVSFFCPTGAFFGSVSDSTPSWYVAVAFASSISPDSENERLIAPL